MRQQHEGPQPGAGRDAQGEAVPQAADPEALWRQALVDPSQNQRKRRIRARIPSAPRCKLCAAPFGGIGGLVMPLMGHPRWPKNPKFCAGCFGMIQAHHGGAEVPCSLVFADVRGSTTMAEHMRPRDVNRLMGQFYDTAFQVLVEGTRSWTSSWATR